MSPRSPNGSNGRDTLGRFVKGNAGGPGNPHARSVHAWRAAFFEAITVADFRAVVEKLVECALAGEPWAIRELLDRTLGKPTQCVDLGGEAEPRNVVYQIRYVDAEPPQHVPGDDTRDAPCRAAD